MTEENVQNVVPETREKMVADDPTLLLVRGKDASNRDYVRQLSNAVLTVLQKYGLAHLKCVGAAAVNNAIKATVVASGEAKKRGVNLIVIPSFQVATFDGQPKTAVMLQVMDR